LLHLTLERHFLSKTILEGIGATHVRCGGIFNNHYDKFTGKSTGKRIL